MNNHIKKESLTNVCKLSVLKYHEIVLVAEILELLDQPSFEVLQNINMGLQSR